MNSNGIVYLTARLNEDNEIEATIETCICLFVYTYCELKNPICLVDEQGNLCCKISPTHFKNKNIKFISDNAFMAEGVQLSLPAVKAARTCIAGVCSVLRWLIKAHLLDSPHHHSEALLGFRGGCLVACAESSLWTKFCELEMPNAVSKVKSSGSKKPAGGPVEIPPCLILLESHLQRPVRTHNILKRKLDIAKKVRKKHSDQNSVEFTLYDENSCPVNGEDISRALENLVITEKTAEFNLHHNYLEGIDLTLADMIVFPCVHYLLQELPASCAPHLRHVVQWHRRLLEDVQSAAQAAGLTWKSTFNAGIEVDACSIIVPEVDKDSLYKRDPSYTKTKIKQKKPSGIIQLLKESNIQPIYETGYCTTLDWEALPSLLHPAKGDLPPERIQRKCQQVESVVSAVLRVAHDGHTVVEFCAGGGHVGLLLAYFLPNCKVILIENKESSISRAITRAEELKLENIYFYQCNLDYFKGSFEVGVSLHACGVATDLVLQQCVGRGASFVCCPCCYGNTHQTHLLTYPRSHKYREANLSYTQYTLLARFADRTELNTPTAEEGELCMGLVDMDRVHWAEERGYEARLTHLRPLSCSTKHNLLVGTRNQ